MTKSDRAPVKKRRIVRRVKRYRPNNSAPPPEPRQRTEHISDQLSFSKLEDNFLMSEESDSGARNSLVRTTELNRDFDAAWERLMEKRQRSKCGNGYATPLHMVPRYQSDEA